MTAVIFRDLGRIDYQRAWDYQESLFSTATEAKLRNRNNPKQEEIKNYLLFCEHPHVYTLGKSGSESNLLMSGENLASENISYYKINRGGDITYHGPGQIVGYPILDLDQFFTDIHKYLRFLEEVIIKTLAYYNIHAGRLEGLTGVWIDPEEKHHARKICAMGVRCSRWITMHGFAFNINTDIHYFNNIVPCGITDKAVTSLHLELGRPVDTGEVKNIILANFREQFNVKWTNE